MTEMLLALVPTYGLFIIALATFLSCLALPIPSSLIMLSGGAFVASGDLAITEVLAAAYGGAVVGDQVGYRAGRWGGVRFQAALDRQPARAAILARARAMVAHWGGLGVFLSTWLLAPLGPWVNVIAGASGMGPWRFTVWDAAGEAVWVALYVGLGFAFAANIELIAGLLGNAVGALSALVVTLGLGAWLFRVRRS